MGRRGAPKDYDPSKPLPDPRHELFCVLYTSHTTPNFFGNGQNSYAFAYGHQKKLDELRATLETARAPQRRESMKKIKSIEAVCRSGATEALIRPYMEKRCDWLMDQMFTAEFMDRELLFVIKQRRDLQSKVRAWEQAAKLKQRISEKVDIKHTF